MKKRKKETLASAGEPLWSANSSAFLTHITGVNVMNGGNQIGSNVTFVMIKGSTSVMEIC